MKTFREWLEEKELNEASKLDVKSVKDILKKSLNNLMPDAFNVSKESDNAGLGGENYIKVTFNGKPRDKDIKEIENIKSILEKLYKIKYYPETFVITVRSK